MYISRDKDESSNYMRPQREVEVLITSEILHSPDEKLWKKLNYDQDICLGELIRNCCVNLGFSDIDTVDGVTRNAAVYLCNRETPHINVFWEYNPYTTLRSFFTTGPSHFNKNSISLIIKQLY